MLKGKKIILVIVSMIVMCLALGSVTSYAAEVNVRSITPRNTSTNNSSNNTSDNNTQNNTNTENRSNSNSSNNTNNSTNGINSISSTNNSSNYSNNNSNSTSNSSSLPYTGTKSSIVFVGIALIASGVYAYKKVSEYRNI